jgi:hypothetical protein
MSQNKEGKIARLGTKMSHVGHTLDKDGNDLSGQLQRVLVGHKRHGGASHEEAEHFIKSGRDSQAALNAAVPVTADSSADRDGSEFNARRSGTLDGRAPRREPPMTARPGRRK